MTTVTIQLPERLERELRARGNASANELSAAVLQLVEMGLSVQATPGPEELSTAEWLKRFHAWVASQPAYGVVGNFDRESIYEGRSE